MTEDFQYDRSSTLVVWTIYDSPDDFPGQIVIRGQEVRRGTPQPKPREGYIIAPSLDAARRILAERGYACVGRDDGDESKIVESWV